jgi:hypothetical protein
MRVHRTNEVARNSVRVFVGIERLEGARQNHSSEVPQHCCEARVASDDAVEESALGESVVGECDVIDVMLERCDHALMSRVRARRVATNE